MVAEVKAKYRALLVPMTFGAATAAILRSRALEWTLGFALLNAGVRFLQPWVSSELQTCYFTASCAAVAVLLYHLASRRPATASAIGAASVAAAGAVVALLSGAGLRSSAGAAVLLGAAAVGVRSMGRMRRRAAAKRTALRQYRSAAHLLPAHAAAAERRRLAAELHDVAAHRMTAVVVSAAAAQRLGDDERRAQALALALDAGQKAVAELDRLVAVTPQITPVTAADVDRLVERSQIRSYRRLGDPMTAPQADLAYRVIRESLTNIARYAEGASVRVYVKSTLDELLVQVDDDGGHAVGSGLGSGSGLAGLDAAVRAAGGTLTAGPHRGGWQVCAQVRCARSASKSKRISSCWPGARADHALVLLATGLSLGFVLLPSAGDRNLLSRALPATVLLLALVCHAAPLAWRRAHALWAFVAGITMLSGWLAACLASLTGLDPADVFLGSWWIELVLLYSLGVSGHSNRRGWWAPLLVAAVGGVALGAGVGIHGSRPGAAAVLASFLVIPTGSSWWAGRLVGQRRLHRQADENNARVVERQHADRAAGLSRIELADELRGDASRHALAVITAAENGQLTDVLSEGRATLFALQQLVGRPADWAAESPPCLAALDKLAARHHLTISFTPAVMPLPTPVDVTAYQAIAAVIQDRAAVDVVVQSSGVQITISGGQSNDPKAMRLLRDIVDHADGRITVTPGHGSVRIWLPKTLL